MREDDDLKQTVRDIYAKIDRVEAAFQKLVEVEVNQSYIAKSLAAYEERLVAAEKELSNWRVARVVLVGVGLLASPIFVAGVTKVLGWH